MIKWVFVILGLVAVYMLAMHFPWLRGEAFTLPVGTDAAGKVGTSISRGLCGLFAVGLLGVWKLKAK